MGISKTVSKVALISVAALGTAFMAQAASAATIMNWDYTVLSSFTSYTATTNGIGSIQASGEGDSTTSYNGEPTTLAWPADGSTQSSVSIEGKVTGQVTTGGSAADGAIFTHNNQTIDSDFNTLDTFTLGTQLTLTESGTSTSQEPINLSFNGNFIETLNSSDPCPVNDGQSACSDIFVLGEGAAFPVYHDGKYVFAQNFSVDGDDYSVILSIAGLDALTDAECRAADASIGCIGLTTKEGQENNFHTSFQILSESIARPVPAPGSLALFAAGFALLGIGFTVRQRKNNNQA